MLVPKEGDAIIAITPVPSSMPSIQPGDVVACWGTDWVSRVISLMTVSVLPPWGWCWPPSHVAIISGDGEWFESTTLVGSARGVQSHAPAERWVAYRGCCVVLRPTVTLTPEQRERMHSELQQMVNSGVPYDLTGAVLSGTRLVRYVVPASERRLFCSELVARVLMTVGLMNWASPAGFSPGRLCRELVKSGAFEVF